MFDGLKTDSNFIRERLREPVAILKNRIDNVSDLKETEQ